MVHQYNSVYTTDKLYDIYKSWSDNGVSYRHLFWTDEAIAIFRQAGEWKWFAESNAREWARQVIDRSPEELEEMKLKQEKGQHVETEWYFHEMQRIYKVNYSVPILTASGLRDNFHEVPPNENKGMFV